MIFPFHDPSFVLFVEGLSYVGIFFISLVGGWILPLPEEVVLLTIGYSAAAGFINPIAGAIVAGAGILVGDIIIFLIIRWEKRLVPKIKDSVEQSWLGQSRLRFLISKRSVGRTVFLFRFVAGLRFLGPIWAGVHQLSLRSFLLYDGVAMMIYTSFIVVLGFFFHDSFLKILISIRSVRHTVFLLVLVIIIAGLLLLYRSFLRRRGAGLAAITDILKNRKKK